MSEPADTETVSRVLDKVLVEASLTRVPRKPAHRDIVLAILCLGMRRRRAYTETEFDDYLIAELAAFNTPVDHVTFRRYLVDLGFAKRDRAGTRYILNYPKLESTLSHDSMDKAHELLREAIAEQKRKLREAKRRAAAYRRRIG